MTRTPYRLSLFGGGLDYPAWFRARGALVVAAAMSRYSYITLRRLPPFFAHHSRVVYAQTEVVDDNGAIRHPSVRACLEHLGITVGVEVHHDGDLPARSGIGSSSAFTVGMLQALHGLQATAVEPDQLARQAIAVEQDCLGEAVGVQDQIMSAHGGVQVLHLGPGPDWRACPLALPLDYREALEAHVLLGFSGLSRTANEHAQEKIRNIEAGKTTAQLDEIQAIAYESLALLNRTGGFDALGQLLHRSWVAKRHLASGLAQEWMDDLYAAGRRAGAYGGKLMGAGGGGFFYFLAPPSRHAAIRSALPQVRVWVPFTVAPTGSQVILRDVD